MAGTLGSPRPLYQAREMERNTNREPHRATPRSPRSALRHCLPQNVYIVTERFSDSAQDVHPRKPLKEIEVDLGTDEMYLFNDASSTEDHRIISVTVTK